MKSAGSTPNLIGLFLIQGWAAAIGIIAFPRAIQVLGPAEYANLVFAEAMVLFLLPLILFAFDFLGVQAIVSNSAQRGIENLDREHAGRIFGLVLYSRGFLFLLVAGLTLVSAWFFSRDLLPVFAGWLLMLLGHALQPNWFYQAIEDNLPLAIIVTGSRLLLLAGVWFLVTGPEHTARFAFIFGGAYAVGGGIACFYAIKRYKISPRRPGWADLVEAARSGWRVFLSNFSVGLFRGIGVPVLTALSAPALLIASYSLCEKFVKAVQALARPLNQYFFPGVLRLASASDSPGRERLGRLFRMTVPQLAFLLGVWGVIGLCWSFRSEIPALGFLEEADEHVLSYGLVIMSGATFFGVVNFTFGVSFLNAVGRKGYLLYSVIACGLASLMMTPILITVSPRWGAFFAYTLGEVLLACLVVTGTIRVLCSRVGRVRA